MSTEQSMDRKIAVALRDAPMMALSLDAVATLVGGADVALETLLQMMLHGMVSLEGDFAVLTIEGRIKYAK